MPAFHGLTPSMKPTVTAQVAATPSPPPAPRPRKTFMGLAVQHAAPVLAAVPQASRGGGEGGQVPAAARGRKAAGGKSASAAIAPKQTSAATKILQATQPEKKTDQQQLNTHLPRGSVPSGARPPGPAGLKDSHLGKRKDGLAGERQTEAVSATRRKITIPSMDLDDDDGDSAPSSQETVEKKPEDTHKKLGALVLEVAGVFRASIFPTFLSLSRPRALVVPQSCLVRACCPFSSPSCFPPVQTQSAKLKATFLEETEPATQIF